MGGYHRPMPPRVTMARADFTYEADGPAGFRAGMCRLGPLLGVDQLGASLCELPPGRAICPYHDEHAEEEWLLVLGGRSTLRQPDGQDVLEPWARAVARRGRDRPPRGRAMR